MNTIQIVGIILVISISLFTWVSWLIGFIIRKINPTNDLFIPVYSPHASYSGSNFRVGSCYMFAFIFILFIIIIILIIIGMALGLFNDWCI